VAVVCSSKKATGGWITDYIVKVKLSPCLIKWHAMKTYSGVEVQLLTFWPWLKVEVIGHLQIPAILLPSERVSILNIWAMWTQDAVQAPWLCCARMICL